MPESLVLVVDDDRDTRTIIRLALEHAGYGVLAAADAEEGIRQAARHRPDLILMDLQMPGLSGIEAARALKADPATAPIPILAVTASGIGSRVQEHGFCGILTKPVLPSAILRAVEICRRHTAGGSQWIDFAPLMEDG